MKEPVPSNLSMVSMSNYISRRDGCTITSGGRVNSELRRPQSSFKASPLGSCLFVVREKRLSVFANESIDEKSAVKQ